MKINRESLIQKDYILLDWNVIKYLKKPRNSFDAEINAIINSLPLRKKYEVPFCEAHMRDLSRSYSDHPDLVEDDLRFLKSLSHSIGLAGNCEGTEFFLTKIDPLDLFKEIVRESPQALNISPDMGPQSIFRVDMQSMNINNPLYTMLTENGGMYSPTNMSNWLNENYEPFFNETEPYKVFRNYLTQLKKDIEGSNSCGLSIKDLEYKKMLIQHMTPFIDSLEITNEDALSAVWKNSISKFLHITHKGTLPFDLLITSAYSMLDLHPHFREKLKKEKNTLSNITRDSKMIYYASSSKYFVTEDKECRKKASFTFKAFNCRSTVLSMEQFLQRFS